MYGTLGCQFLLIVQDSTYGENLNVYSKICRSTRNVIYLIPLFVNSNFDSNPLRKGIFPDILKVTNIELYRNWVKRVLRQKGMGVRKYKAIS